MSLKNVLFVLVIVFSICPSVLAFVKAPTASMRLVNNARLIQMSKTSNDYPILPFSAALTASTSLVPLAAQAVDNSGSQQAVFIPILISFLTIGPFLYYQQALKPKERTVKQIELDRNLRAKDKTVNFGTTKEARAEKKK